MKKQIFTLENVQEDLYKVADFHEYRTGDKYIGFVVSPILIVAILVGIFRLWIALVGLVVPIYYGYLWIRAISEVRLAKRAVCDALERQDFSICEEKLSYISRETIYEPHRSGRHSHATREVWFFNFESGARWRVPPVAEHYSWSDVYYMSSTGLENTSVEGNEFYLIRLQGYHDIAYVYNKNMFELKEK